MPHTLKPARLTARVSTLAILAALAATAAAPVSAQSPFERVEQGWSFFGNGMGPSELRLGVGGAYAPDYVGSDDYQFTPLPLITARNVFGFNFQPFALSYNLASYTGQDGLWSVTVGPRVGLELGRDEDDNAALEGLGDVGTSVLPGGFVNLRVGPVMASASVGTDVADGHGGTVADFGLSAPLPITEQIFLIPGVSASWADEDYMQSMFGITPAQFAASPIYTAAYTPDAGFKSVGASLTAVYNFNENWSANTRLGYERLIGDAADSPLVADQGSENQLSVIFGVSRAFRF
ncbi:MAG: MipA/OmpV family protein [Devosiaceae bacterium]|nr:MipA/OmpV family protein [Devosiaceae bacterium MH13]